MNLIPVKTPKLIKGIFPKYVWNMPNDQKVIYLTFDDGPTPEITHWTLNLLKSYNAKATFFCIGNNIKKYPQIFNDILEGEHAVGNHTFHHPKGWQTTTNDYVEQVLKTQDLIDQHVLSTTFKTPNSNDCSQSEVDNPYVEKRPVWANQQPSQTEKIILGGASLPKLFRPPYGQITQRQGQRLLTLGYKIIMWDILAFDWKDSLSDIQCAKNAISKTEPGSIIVFHDSVKASKRMTYAFQKTLEHFSQQGYQFKSIE